MYIFYLSGVFVVSVAMCANLIISNWACGMTWQQISHFLQR
jgi:hypothetical protein